MVQANALAGNAPSSVSVAVPLIGDDVASPKQPAICRRRVMVTTGALPALIEIGGESVSN